MKILHILNTGKYSGAENVAITIINKMKKDNDIVYVSLDGPIREYLEENRIKYEVIKKITISEIRRVIKKYQPDIIHAHDFTASLVCSMVCGKVKLISHIHNNNIWMKKINIYSILYLLSSIKYKKILLVSESIINEYIFSRLIRKKVEIIGNPIDIQKIINKAEEKIESKKYDIIFLGRFAIPKNPIKFIETINKIEDKKNIHAIMIGDGPLKEECKNKIEQLKLNNIIEIRDFMQNPYVVLKNSKILCMTSDWEGYGLVAVEALALGKPVVATNVGGIPNIVNNDCGLVAINTDEMITEISKLLKDKKYYEQKSINALNRAKEINNIDLYIKKLKSIYMN